MIGWGLTIGYPTVLIPGLQHKFGNVTDNDLDLASDDQVSWIGSINFLFVPCGDVLSGFLADPVGKRRMMQVNITNFSEKNTRSSSSKTILVRISDAESSNDIGLVSHLFRQQY